MSSRQNWGWGVSSTPPSPTPATAAPHSKEPLRLASDTRSYIAQLIFPDLSPEEAGTQVSRDIHANPALHSALYELGYRDHGEGYKPSQIRLLLEFYGKV